MNPEWEIPMTVLQTQGVHHITFVGSNREATIAFYQGVLGMPLVLDQPNLDVPDETHLYFDAGDGRLITFLCARRGRTTRRPILKGLATCTIWPLRCRGRSI